MQKEMTELFAKSTETAMEATRKLGELNLRTMERLLQQQAEMAGIYMDIAARGLELFGKAKGMQELVQGQAELTRECGERGMETLRKGLSLVNETGAEYGDLAKAGMKVAQEQYAQVASATLKAA